jgi:hypothetical protein
MQSCLLTGDVAYAGHDTPHVREWRSEYRADVHPLGGEGLPVRQPAGMPGVFAREEVPHLDGSPGGRSGARPTVSYSSPLPAHFGNAGQPQPLDAGCLGLATRPGQRVGGTARSEGEAAWN